MTATADNLHEGVALPTWPADARFTELVRRRNSELVKVALLLTGNRADAEDAVQEAIVAVSATWSTVTERGAYAYLRTAVVRKAIDGRRRARPVADPPELPVDDLGFLRLEQDRAFFAMVQELPAQQRAVVVLRYYAGQDDRAIGRMLDCSASTVRSQAARALAKLRTAARDEKGRR